MTAALYLVAGFAFAVIAARVLGTPNDTDRFGASLLMFLVVIAWPVLLAVAFMFAVGALALIAARKLGAS